MTAAGLGGRADNMDETKRQRGIRIRIRIVAILISLTLVMVLIRAIQLTVIDREGLLKYAEKQYLSHIQLAGRSGNIYDQKRNALAISIEVKSIRAHPRQVENKTRTAQILSQVLGLDVQEVLKKLNSSHRSLWIKRRISRSEAQQLSRLSLKGVSFTPESKRYYPSRSLAAQLMGYVGLDPRGLAGLELKYDDALRGKPISLAVIRDNRRKKVYRSGLSSTGLTEGKSLVLTIDSTIQFLAEQALNQQVKKYKAVNGSLIILNPHTGEVMAMAAAPAFDPNRFANYPPKLRRNHGITDTFEPGSTFKAILAAAALETKAVSPKKTFNCTKRRCRIGRYTFRDRRAFGWQDMSGILKYSINCGSVFIVRELGSDRFHRFIRGFGFGTKTGINLPGEASGKVTSPKTWFGKTKYDISYGYGITVTALQLVTAISAVANGGQLMRPFVLRKIIGRSKQVLKEFKPKVIRRILSRETAWRLTRMLTKVTEPKGTGIRAAIKGIPVAGKTGTAQKPDPIYGGYSEDRHVVSFYGFAPAERPRLAAVVVINDPQGKNVAGGTVAAPVFGKVMGRALRYLGVASKEDTFHVARHRARKKKSSRHEPSYKKSTAKKAGHIKALSHGEASPAMVTGPRLAVPDFKGLSLRKAVELALKQGVDLDPIGSGQAIRQNPLPGTVVRLGSRCRVVFKPPS